jgi:hypothetical protein
MRGAATRKGPVDRVLAALVNVLSVVYVHAYFPCHSNGLKDVAACLGYSWSDPASSGLQSIVWRKRWEAGHADEWKQKLLTYNREDCAALRRVTEFLRANEAGASGTKPAGANDPSVMSVEELDRLGVIIRRGRIQFVHPDYQHINGCAHFDYQRERVYVRTGKARKNRVRRPGQRRNHTLRVSKRVHILCRKCPRCGSQDVVRWATGENLEGTCPASFSFNHVGHFITVDMAVAFVFRCRWSRLTQDHVNHPAAANMRCVGIAAVIQNVVVVATRVLQRIGQNRHRPEVPALVHLAGE